jgi:hypothetical protein
MNLLELFAMSMIASPSGRHGIDVSPDWIASVVQILPSTEWLIQQQRLVDI